MLKTDFDSFGPVDQFPGIDALYMDFAKSFEAERLRWCQGPPRWVSSPCPKTTLVTGLQQANAVWKIRRPRSAHCSHDQRLAPVSKTGALTIVQDGTSARENVGRRINQHYALTPRCTTVYTQYNRANRYLNK